jgi:hypothetical protein
MIAHFHDLPSRHFRPFYPRIHIRLVQSESNQV